MTAMPPLRDILNNTPVNAIDVDFNFNTIEAHMGSEVINRDGSVAMTGPLTLPAPPTAPTQAATKQYVDQFSTPVGAIMQFAAATAPAGWAICDGTQKSTTDPLYAALFAVIGYTYGGSVGNFNLPDMRTRVPVGLSAGDAAFGALNQKGGAKDAVVPNHTHDLSNHAHGVTVTATGTDHQHYNQPLARGAQGTAYASKGEPFGWPGPGAGSGILFGDPPVSSGMGSRSPAGWFSVPITVDVGSQWTDTMNQNTSHSHPVAIGTPTNNSTGQATGAVAPTNQNLPPYITINYIIRIGV